MVFRWKTDVYDFEKDKVLTGQYVQKKEAWFFVRCPGQGEIKEIPYFAQQRDKLQFNETATVPGAVHNLFTEKTYFPLAFFFRVGYYMLALRSQEC